LHVDGLGYAVRLSPGVVVCPGCVVTNQNHDPGNLSPTAIDWDECEECNRVWRVVKAHGAWHDTNLSLMAQATAP